jgi:tripartite-type tricarboxylate transporter receptor subunit TctC
MKNTLTRRLLAPVALVVPMTMLAVQPAAAQEFPQNSLRILVGFTAGSSTDVAARLLAEAMSEELGQRVLVENRPGAASNIATQAVASSEADGYTLLMGTVANTIGTALEREVDFEFPVDFSAIALVGAVPMILTVPADNEAQDIESFIEQAAAQGQPLLYGSAGVGTAPHLSAELFATSVGIEMEHVPYGGTGDAVRDLIEGRIDVMFAPQPSAIGGINEGELRALATSLSRRSGMLPDVPTISEAAVEGFDTSVWFGLMAPQGTPEPVLGRLNEAVNAALASEGLQQGFANAGVEPLGGTPEEFEAYITREISNWSAVIEAAGITLD